MTSETIKAENVGPVEEAMIPLDAGGGVTVLMGFNGSGKDSLLDAVGRMAGGKQPVTCRDGAAKGSIEGLGVRLNIGKSTRKSGECQALSLTGKFDLSDFVEPPIKDGEAADRYRLKALLTIRGVEGNMDAFREIAPEGSEIDKFISGEAMAQADIVEQARLIKVDLERKAREIEDAAQKAHGKAEGAKNAAGEVAANAEYDEADMTAKLMAAVSAHARLTEQEQVYQTAQAQAIKARQALAAVKAGPSIAECEKRAAAAAKTLQELKAMLQKAEAEDSMAMSAMTAAKREAVAVQGWHDSIEAAANVKPVAPVDIEQAAASVAEIREKVQQGAVIREAIRQHAAAREHEAEARALEAQAESIRGAAKATDDVLSGLVASGRIRVDGGRLVVDHPRRGQTLFAELSKGEKWRLAIMEAVDRIREIGADGMALVPIPQQAWEGLQPSIRAEIWREAKRQRVNVIAAQCDDGALRAEVYTPAPELQTPKDEAVKPVETVTPKPKPAAKPTAKAEPKPQNRTPAKPADEISFD
jgi:hypothetical protein